MTPYLHTVYLRQTAFSHGTLFHPWDTQRVSPNIGQNMQGIRPARPMSPHRLATPTHLAVGATPAPCTVVAAEARVGSWLGESGALPRRDEKPHAMLTTADRPRLWRWCQGWRVVREGEGRDLGGAEWSDERAKKPRREFLS